MNFKNIAAAFVFLITVMAATQGEVPTFRTKKERDDMIKNVKVIVESEIEAKKK